KGPTCATAAGRLDLLPGVASLRSRHSAAEPCAQPLFLSYVNVDQEQAGRGQGFASRFQGDLLEVVRLRASADDDLASPFHAQVGDTPHVRSRIARQLTDRRTS